MEHSPDTNADVWKSGEIIAHWTAEAEKRERQRGAAWRFMAELLAFEDDDAFTFLDLGAGTGSATKEVLRRYPHSTAILADFSAQMMDAGKDELAEFAGRFRYLEFDLTVGGWPAEIPTALDAIITSMCVHHLPDHRKESLFAEILQRLAPGSWYVNYDPVTAEDPVVQALWERVNDHEDPDAAHKKHHRTAEELRRYENHVRYLIPLDRQLGYLRAAGFEGVDVYWKRLENVIYGGRRPAAG
ncbi:MAG: methyltransferase domain-containing protein [Mycobacteriaceae bacterium]